MQLNFQQLCLIVDKFPPELRVMLAVGILSSMITQQGPGVKSQESMVIDTDGPHGKFFGIVGVNKAAAELRETLEKNRERLGLG